MRVNSVTRNVFAVTARIDRHGGEKEHQDGDHGIARRERGGHLLDTGNRPSGRSTSTIAISR